MLRKRAWRSGSSDLNANATTDHILFQSQVARAVILSPTLPLSLARVQVPESFGQHGPFALEASHSSSSQKLSPESCLQGPTPCHVGRF
jgi:hypothetical protein